MRSVGCEPPQLVVPHPEMIACNENVELSQQTLFLLRHTHPISRLLCPCWPACGVDVAERGGGEVNRGGEPQQSKVVVDGVGVPVWVLEFPESWADEKGPNLPLHGSNLLSYSNGCALVGSVSAGHADDNVNGGCTRAERSNLFEAI